MTITNEKLKDYPFLQGMSEDDYFPQFLVEKGKKILTNLCEEIEAKNPKDDEALYVLTHAATDQFNALSEEFEENESEIETVAREWISEDFSFIASAYGFDAEREELIATRDW